MAVLMPPAIGPLTCYHCPLAPQQEFITFYTTKKIESHVRYHCGVSKITGHELDFKFKIVPVDFMKCLIFFLSILFQRGCIETTFLCKDEIQEIAPAGEMSNQRLLAAKVERATEVNTICNSFTKLLNNMFDFFAVNERCLHA